MIPVRRGLPEPSGWPVPSGQPVQLVRQVRRVRWDPRAMLDLKDLPGWRARMGRLDLRAQSARRATPATPDLSGLPEQSDRRGHREQMERMVLPVHKDRLALRELPVCRDQPDRRVPPGCKARLVQPDQQARRGSPVQGWIRIGPRLPRSHGNMVQPYRSCRR